MSLSSASATPSAHASPGASPSPEAVHDMVCEFITAQAEASGGGWAGYREVFLSAEVQDLIRSRLMAEAGGAAGSSSGAAGSSIGDGSRSPKKQKKKRKLDDAIAAAVPAPAAAADEVSWTVCCLDGTTFSVALPEHAPVAEAKRAIGVLRELSHFAMELFVKDREEPLEDEERLSSAEKVPLFMLPKPASDRLALEALFKSCGGAGWKKKGGWMTDAALGEWEGVTVDAETRVIKLVLSSNNLAGPLPSEIQQLSALRRLHLNGNKLTGPIPAELGQLGALTELYLNANQLSGPIPKELGQLGELRSLLLNENQLSGPIPKELGQLGGLTYLLLNENQLTGPIPVELRQLGKLRYLWLQRNQLSGQQALRLHMQEHNPGCACCC
jgi:hypothetical protein